MKDNYDFLDPEIAKQFPTSEAVNKALRKVIEQEKKPSSRSGG